MSTDVKDLFGDDSSSDEDVAMQNGGAAAESPSKRVIQEDEDDVEREREQKDPATIQESSKEGEADVEMKDAEENKEDSTATQQQPEQTPAENTAVSGGKDETKTSNETKDLFGEDDESDEEEDAEFDDEGNVVGSSAPSRPPQAETDADATQTPKSPQRPKKPRHMQVLESERPPEGTSLHMTKLPNLVGIQPEAFDPDTYSKSLEERDYRVYVHSMIRWRYARDEDTGEFKRDSEGKLMRESNARIVKWDDGSYTLHVGNEVLDMDKIDSSSNGFAGLNGYLYLSQKATFRQEDDPDGTNDIPGGTSLECMGAIQSRLIPRPSSLQSDAHKNLTVALRQRATKKARIAEYVTQEDPEKAKLERIKVKQDLEKASARRERTYRAGGRRSTPGMNRRYLEEAEDAGNYDSVNIRDLKRSNVEELMDYGEDSEEEDDEDPVWARSRGRPTRRRQQERAGDDESSSEEELHFGEDDEEEEEEDEEVITKKPSSAGKKRAHQAVVDDDEDD